LLPKAAQQFEEWFQAPLAEESSDPRFQVRRAHPTEFERLYDLVDEAFAVKRPRAVFDWLYRGNPAGAGRCWKVSSGWREARTAHGRGRSTRDGAAASVSRR